MISHGLLFRTILNSKLFGAPGVVDFVTDTDVSCHPFQRQAHERPGSVDHELGKVPSWEYLGVAMIWSNQVGHVELANAGVAGDNVTTLRALRTSGADVSLCYVSYICNGIVELRNAHLVLSTVHSLQQVKRTRR